MRWNLEATTVDTMEIPTLNSIRRDENTVRKRDYTELGSRL